MTRLVLIRHGESVSTVERRIGGVRTCGGLSPLGRKQAEALAARLARTGEIQADVLVASTMRRAVETAEIIAPALGDLPIEQIAERRRARARPRLRRHDLRRLHRALRPARLVGRPATSSASPAGRRSPSSSTAPPPPCTGWPHDHEGETIVVACHAGVVDAGLRSFLNVSMVGRVRAEHHQHVAHRAGRTTAPALAAAPLQRRRPPRGPAARDAARLTCPGRTSSSSAPAPPAPSWRPACRRIRGRHVAAARSRPRRTRPAAASIRSPPWRSRAGCGPASLPAGPASVAPQPYLQGRGARRARRP